MCANLIFIKQINGVKHAKINKTVNGDNERLKTHGTFNGESIEKENNEMKRNREWKFQSIRTFLKCRNNEHMKLCCMLFIAIYQLIIINYFNLFV